MSTHSGPSPSAPTSAVRNTVGREKEMPQGNPNRLVTDAALREYCDKHYNQFLPILAEKMHQEKVHQEKIKVVKARLNFEEVSQHSESGTPSRRRDLRKRLRSRRIHSMSESPEPRRGRFESPRKRDPKRKTVFKRLEKAVAEILKLVTKVLAQEEHSLLMRNIITKEHPHAGRKRCQKMKEAHEDTRSHGQKSKDQALRMAIYPSHGIRKITSRSFRRQQKWNVGQCQHGATCSTPHLPDPLRRKSASKILWKSNISSREKESLQRIFVRRFKVERRDVKGAPEIMRISGFMHGIINPELIKRLYDKIPKSVDKMMRITTPFLRGETLPGNKKLDGSGHCPLNRVQWRNHMAIRAIITTGEDWRRRTFNLGFDEFCDIGGILTLKSSKIIPIECAADSGPEGQPPATHQAIEERIKVAINPDYPEQTIMIGSTLTEEGQNKQCDLLQRNLDMFAWKPADMTGVLRHIAEHRLNIREGCPLIRQNRRGQAADRNQAIQEEVEKLVDAGCAKVEWKAGKLEQTEEVESAFKQMKQLIAKLPTLTALEEKEELIVYLAAAKEAVIERPKEDSLDTPMDVEEELSEPWLLFTDGSSCTDDSGAGLILTNPEGVEFTYALRFRFEATNNEAEYKALIAGLRIAEEMELKEKSINEVEVLAVVEEEGNTWMTLIYEYLTEETLLAEVNKARAVRCKSQRFVVINGVLYKKSFLGPWLRYVGPLQANYVLREIHEGSCSMHAGTRSVVAKALRTGYYWPTMHKDASGELT
ncbi:reverse transcriptase domain-containing protein [Tanacetum coccineum]